MSMSIRCMVIAATYEAYFQKYSQIWFFRRMQSVFECVGLECLIVLVSLNLFGKSSEVHYQKIVHNSVENKLCFLINTSCRQHKEFR